MSSASPSDASTDTINWRLDKVYEHLIEQVKQLLAKKSYSENELFICRKWLKILDRTSLSEKVARNCLLNLMMQQLKEKGHIELPFINLEYCNMNLDKVMQDLNQSPEDSKELQSKQSKILITQTKEEFDPTIIKPAYVQFEVLSVINEETEPDTSKSKALDIDTDLRNSDMLKATLLPSQNSSTLEKFNKSNKQLRDDIATVQIQLDKQLEANKQLEKKFRKLQKNVETKSENLRSVEIKELLLKLIRKYLGENNMLDVYEMKQMPVKAFECMFQELAADDLEFTKELCGFDIQFNKILSDRFKQEYKARKQALIRHSNHKFQEFKIKLKRKYEERIHFTNWQHLLQLKFIKLKCFTALRKVFVNTYVGDEEQMWDELRILEQRYQHILCDIF